jgi:nitroimidazol reductase NimA-like FMN-containing flavoprotein (pyridoxamine 5'-phosphate oxidase superfamily)
MQIHEMTEEECRAALQQADFGRLACVRDNQPYIVPVNFSFDGQHVYGVTMLGQKVEWMRSNPFVCLEIDERLDQYHWSSVVVFGRYEEVPDTSEYQRVRAHALEALQKRTLWWEPACVPAERREQRAPVLYRIEVKQLTGRRAGPNPIEAAVVVGDQD